MTTTLDSTRIRPTAAGYAAATPDTRDRVVDFLRLASIAVVVLGHWLMAVVTWKAGRFGGANAIEQIPGAWLLTWFLQVMPVFFFVGGFANAIAWDARRRRGQGYGSYLTSRLERLVRPAALFAGVWIAAAAVLGALGVQGIEQGIQIVAKPLWFLAVYVIVVAAAPAMRSLHERYRLAVPVSLAAAAALIDVARIAFDVPVVGWLNFAFVWLFAHQLGFFYADGSLVRAGRRVHAVLCAGGLAMLIGLTGSGVYSLSMVGTASDRVSNNTPPSIAIVALTVWMVGAVMLARPRLAAWLRRPRVWTVVIAAGSAAMTVFLWHLTAVLIVAPVAMPLGFPQPDAGTAAWWLTRPLWMALLSLPTVALVAAFARFERPGPRPARPASAGSPAGSLAGSLRALTAAALLVVSLAGFATWGFDGLADPSPLRPPMSAAAMAAALALLRPRATPRKGVWERGAGRNRAAGYVVPGDVKRPGGPKCPPSLAIRSRFRA